MPSIEMVPKHTLSFKEFVRLTDQQRKALGQVTIIPPELGQPGFGCVVAEKPIFVQRVYRASKRKNLFGGIRRRPR
jgi:hypothetical protein